MNEIAILKVMLGVAYSEGYFDFNDLTKGLNRPQRNNNPGDLRGWPGFPMDGGRFSKFPDAPTGWSRLRCNIYNHALTYRNHTLLDWIGGKSEDNWPGYAPATDGNDPVAYSATLAKFVGCSPDDTLYSIIYG